MWWVDVELDIMAFLFFGLYFLEVPGFFVSRVSWIVFISRFPLIFRMYCVCVS